MSNNNYWEDEDDDFEFENQPQISKEEARFRDLRKAKKSDEKRIKELTEKLESLTKAQGERTVKEVLEKKGVNPKAARLILKDLDGDLSEESVSNWLDDNAELFGLTVAEDASKTNAAVNAMRQQDSVTQGAITPDRGQDLEMKIDAATSAEELRAILYSS
jgi:DNA-directed RNA polymerase subunit F